MKILSPAGLVLVAMALPVVVLASVFGPSLTAPASYEVSRERAGSGFTKALWSANLTTENRDWEGKNLFDQGVAAYDSGAEFKPVYKDIYRECLAQANEKYCAAAGESFSKGFSYARSAGTH